MATPRHESGSFVPRSGGVFGAGLCLALALCMPTAWASDPVLSGSGSTFVYPLMGRWIAALARRPAGLEVEYQPLSSGRGVQDISTHAVDFGATDDPMSDEEMAKVPGILHIPIALGAVVVAYNVPGIKDLRAHA